MTSLATSQETWAIAPPLPVGNGLELRPWDDALATQMAGWSDHGFPYHAFDLGLLRDPVRSRDVVAEKRRTNPHVHFVAVEHGVAIGRVSVNLQDNAGLYIWAVHVPPEHEGRGLCRAMLSTLMPWLTTRYPGRDFVMTSNTFAVRAHAAYLALGFRITHTRWINDPEMAAALMRCRPDARDAIAPHVRFWNGRWETRAHIFRRSAASHAPRWAAAR